MEHESHHHHHPHGTGFRWLDVSLAVAATIVSLVSLWLALHSAHSMEKLVAANSYPYLDLMRSTSTLPAAPGEQTRAKVEYEMVNNGVGPARVEWVELRFRNKPVADLSALLDACCSGQEGDMNGFNVRGNVVNALIRSGGSLAMFSWTEPATSNPRFATLHRQMDQISYSACYCSVFDECYVRNSEDNKKPEPVEQCVAPAVPFRPGFAKKG